MFGPPEFTTTITAYGPHEHVIPATPYANTLVWIMVNLTK
jgi:hypothetical protein